ncbi:unnamed protein product [Camellia sinensis]
MAYANQNQGVFVPYHQLIDPRSLNQPVTFVTGPPIALNFINPSSGTVLVPPNPTLVPSFGFALDPAFLVRIEEARSRSLLQFMADEGLVPSPEEEIRRKNAIEKLKQIVMEWIKSVAHKRQLHRQHTTDASATVLTYGSYGLGVHNSESDIDALCVGPCFATLAEDFFVVLHSMLTSRPEVSEVHCVKDAKVPLMRFKLDGISIDLPYAQLKVMSVPENVDILNPFFLSNIDETSWRSLSGVHANKCILRLLPNMEVSSMLSMGSYGGAFRVLVDLIYSRIVLFQVFKSLLRCVKLWAKRRGVYGNLLGFFGGVHLAILAAFICQRHPNVSLNGLISNFFKTYAFWDWRTPVILQDGMVPTTISASEIRSLMPIRLPCRPHEYCHSNITKSTFYRITTEFHQGHALTKDLLRPDFGWACLFEPFPYTKKYTRFVKICLAASDQDELGKWVGWVKSRFRSLLVKEGNIHNYLTVTYYKAVELIGAQSEDIRKQLEELQSFCDPNPTEYVDVNVTEPNIVFYWGLGRNGFLDLRSVKEYFVQSIRAGYQGRTGTMKLSVVQASQLPKNAQFDN